MHIIRYIFLMTIIAFSNFLPDYRSDHHHLPVAPHQEPRQEKPTLNRRDQKMWKSEKETELMRVVKEQQLFVQNESKRSFFLFMTRVRVKDFEALVWRREKRRILCVNRHVEVTQPFALCECVREWCIHTAKDLCIYLYATKVKKHIVILWERRAKLWFAK